MDEFVIVGILILLVAITAFGFWIGLNISKRPKGHFAPSVPPPPPFHRRPMHRQQEHTGVTLGSRVGRMSQSDGSLDTTALMVGAAVGYAASSRRNAEASVSQPSMPPAQSEIESREDNAAVFGESAERVPDAAPDPVRFSENGGVAFTRDSGINFSDSDRSSVSDSSSSDSGGGSSSD